MLSAWIAATLERFGRLDVLVNNAGICPLCPIEEVTEGLFDRVVAVNLKSTFFESSDGCWLGIQVAGLGSGRSTSPRLVERRAEGGRSAPYAATKAGVISLTKSFATYLAPFGICVNAIAPGPVTTNLTSRLASRPSGRSR